MYLLFWVFPHLHKEFEGPFSRFSSTKVQNHWQVLSPTCNFKLQYSTPISLCPCYLQILTVSLTGQLMHCRKVRSLLEVASSTDIGGFCAAFAQNAVSTLLGFKRCVSGRGVQNQGEAESQHACSCASVAVLVYSNSKGGM